MLSAEDVARFHDQGFLLGPRVLTDEQIASLQDETLRVIAQRDDPTVKQPVLCHNFTNNPDRAVWQIVNIWEASAPFHDLITNRQVVAAVEQLTGEPDIRLWHDQIQYKPAETGGVNHWHQDSPYWPILQPKDQQITAWVALDDADEDNGCMRMVPGSHRWGVQIKFLEALPDFDTMPNEFEGHDVKVVSCPVKKGHVHFHHALTWHGSGSNLSGRPRRAIALHYMTGKTVFDPTGDHCMKPFVTTEPGEPIIGDAFPLVSR